MKHVKYQIVHQRTGVLESMLQIFSFSNLRMMDFWRTNMSNDSGYWYLDLDPQRTHEAAHSNSTFVFCPFACWEAGGGFKQWLTPWFTTHIRLRIGWCDGTPFMPKYSIGPVSKLILEWWIPMEVGISGVLFWSQAEIHMATWGSITHSSKPSGPSIVPIFCRQADHGRAAVRFWGPESDQPGVKASWNPRHYGHFVASIYKWAISLLGRIFLGWVGDGRFR